MSLGTYRFGFEDGKRAGREELARELFGAEPQIAPEPVGEQFTHLFTDPARLDLTRTCKPGDRCPAHTDRGATPWCCVEQVEGMSGFMSGTIHNEWGHDGPCFNRTLAGDMFQVVAAYDASIDDDGEVVFSPI